MKIIVIADENQRKSFHSTTDSSATIAWMNSPDATGHADCCVDLAFDQSDERLNILCDGRFPLVIINDVTGIRDISSNVIRINAWPTLVDGSTIEACGPESKKEDAELILSFLGKKMAWIPCQPGFVRPRVISMIINEAYLALGENVSTRDDINTAMKLGTNYPYGPFEWAELIGPGRIARLLMKLAESDPKYTPAPLLLKEAGLA